MLDINDLRRAREAAANDMTTAATALTAAEDALSALESPTDEATAAVTDAQSAFEAAEAAFETANDRVQRQERVDAATAVAAISEADTPAPPVEPAAARNPEDRGVEAGLIVGALAVSGCNREQAIGLLESAGHSGVSAALATSPASAGGVLIPEAYSTALIELLKSRVVVRRAGARTVPMPAGKLTQASQLTRPTASYGGENALIMPSQPSYDDRDMGFKKLRCLVPVSNDLLSFSAIDMARHTRDTMLTEMALKEDLAFLRFDGTALDPVGIRHWVPVAHWTGDVGKTADEAETALRRCKSLVEDSDVKMVAPGWVMRASTKNFLASLRDANGNKVFPSIDDSGTLHGYPIHTTSQIPDNLGAGTNETEVYFADFNEVVIGDSKKLMIATSTEAAFVDAGGTTHSAFQEDMTLLRAISEHDLAVDHAVGLAGFNGVGWTL